MSVVDYVLYVHSSKESQYHDWETELGGDSKSEAARNFSYVGGEIAFQCLVDLDTGECMACGVIDNGELVWLERPIEV